MEQEIKRKRGREEEEEEEEVKEESSNKSTKMQADHPSQPRSVRNDIKIERRSRNHEEDSNTSNEITGDNSFAFGVFDFPWLKEEGSSMISKADEEEWCLEDTIFSSSLYYSTASAAEFSGQHLWEATPEATCIGSCIDVPVDKFEEINAWSLEMEATVD